MDTLTYTELLSDITEGGDHEHLAAILFAPHKMPQHVQKSLVAAVEAQEKVGFSYMPKRGGISIPEPGQRTFTVWFEANEGHDGEVMGDAYSIDFTYTV